MAKNLQNSFLEGAETDLKAARVLVKEGLFSQSLYMVEQALEKSLNFTGTLSAVKPHPLLDFIRLTRDLIFCMLIRNDVYRYPHFDYQNENLDMLNNSKMKENTHN